ncbi:MAG: hypothetical protein NTX00_00325 [Candidatus Parcubacteria bacterium]|nr:hypothetical protein [Candidatus Parcubacteria bacterium]
MRTAEKEGSTKLCGEFVELFKLNPPPRDMGAFFIALRQKWSRKILILECGLTKGGADLFKKKFNPTTLLELIALKGHKDPITLKRQGEKYILN